GSRGAGARTGRPRGGGHCRGRARGDPAGARGALVSAPETRTRGAFETRSNAETEEIAARVGASFVGGEVVLLHGDLGAGKTVFVRGLARGMGLDADEVASPTFVLLTTYPGPTPL